MVTIATSKGNIKLKLFTDKAPKSVANFLKYTDDKFYDGTIFHRVIDGFMIQGGDPMTTDRSQLAMWGRGRGPRTLHQEFNDTPFTPGVLGAARGDDVNSASCQFFIVTGQAEHLNGQYTAFGRLATPESEGGGWGPADCLEGSWVTRTSTTTSWEVVSGPCAAWLEEARAAVED